MPEQIPDYLRDPIRRAFNETPTAVWRANSVETGQDIRRKLYDNAPSVFSVTWILDSIEFAAFDGWFKLKTDQGSSSFIIPLLTGFGLVDHECTFRKNPRYKPMGGRTQVTASLEARFKQFDTDEGIQDLLDGLQIMFDAGDPRPSETLLEFSGFMRKTLPDAWAAFL